MSWLSKTLGLDKLKSQTGRVVAGDILKQIGRNAAEAGLSEMTQSASIGLKVLEINILSELSRIGINSTDRGLIEEALNKESQALLSRMATTKTYLLDRWF
jgi:hypothetical protein